MSSIYIAAVYSCIHNITNGGFVSFANFPGPGDKGMDKAKILKI